MDEGFTKVGSAQDTAPRNQAIAEVRARLAQAESATGRFRQAGSREQYLASYFLAEALERQLDALAAAERLARRG